MKVDIEEMEHCLLGQEESEVDIRHIVMNVRGKKRRRLFRVLSAQGQSEFVVVSAALWDKFSMVLARQEEECQELSTVIQKMSERQKKLLVMMECKRNFMSEAPEGLRKQIFRESRTLTGRSLERNWNCSLERERARERQDLGGNIKRREECRSGGRESYSYCLEVVSLGKQ